MHSIQTHEIALPTEAHKGPPPKPRIRTIDERSMNVVDRDANNLRKAQLNSAAALIGKHNAPPPQRPSWRDRIAENTKAHTKDEQQQEPTPDDAVKATETEPQQAADAKPEVKSDVSSDATAPVATAEASPSA
jgi:hypothetical protein